MLLRTFLGEGAFFYAKRQRIAQSKKILKSSKKHGKWKGKNKAGRTHRQVEKARTRRGVYKRVLRAKSKLGWS
ncbi:MAG: hypothetical protein WC292_03465 [Clostridia bacterium]